MPPSVRCWFHYLHLLIGNISLSLVLFVEFSAKRSHITPKFLTFFYSCFPPLKYEATGSHNANQAALNRTFSGQSFLQLLALYCLAVWFLTRTEVKESCNSILLSNAWCYSKFICTLLIDIEKLISYDWLR